MKKALFFENIENNKIQCKLCPHNCIINEGKTGVCRVRKNINAQLYSENYEKVSALHFDPIEKKPFYHFYPGTIILSIGSVGCNLRCKFCQNWEISQTSVTDYPSLNNYSVEDILKIALKKTENIGISYTYNEPTVWYEYMLDIAKQAKLKKLKNVMVTNGYINQEPFIELIPYMDAFSVDLKAFTEDFYKNVSFAKLEPVKKSLKLIKEHNRHLEITNLVVPTLNDNEKIFTEMVQWIAEEIGKNTVLHLSRYFPVYKCRIEQTPVPKLLKFYDIAKKYLNNVYLGNVIAAEGKNTYCIKCKKPVIKRDGYFINKTGIDNEGNCKYCGSNVIKEIE